MPSPNWINAILAPSHAGEWISGISGIAGAIMGGAVTMVMTEWFNARARRRDERAKRAEIAYSAYQRLNHIYSISKLIAEHLATSMSKRPTADSFYFLTTQGMHRMSAPVVFPIEETWALTQSCGVEVGNAIGSLDHVFNLLLSAFDDYGQKREGVMQALPPPIQAEGNRGTMAIDEADLLRLMPRIAPLEVALSELLPMAQRLTTDSFNALTLLVGARSLPLGSAFRVGLTDPKGEDVVLVAGNPIPRPAENQSPSPQRG